MKKNKIALELKNISKSFSLSNRSQSFTILNKINLKIKTGTTTAIVGKSGSGKSTLLSLMAGLDSPDSGDIIINGEKINVLDEKKLTEFRARNISIVFQQFQLINHLNVLDNIILPLYLTNQFDDFSREKAKRLLAEIDLLVRFNFFPKELSGGEQQRVAIARSLIVEPEIILADEPTGNLDVNTGNKVIEQFFKLVKNKNKTLLLVTHDLSIAKKCQQVLEIKNNQLLRKK